MNRFPELRNGSVVPYVGLPYPNGFEGCWAGEFSSPDSSILPLICLGSVDGKLLFTDQKFEKIKPLNGLGSVSGEAINGVARFGSWVAVSTPMEVSLWSMRNSQNFTLPHGSHGVTHTSNGIFLAALGKDGILSTKISEVDNSLKAHQHGNGNQYIYRVISLGTQQQTEVIACACRREGIVAGIITASQKLVSMRTATFANIDIVDICPLGGEMDSLGIAALGHDGSIILSRDIMNDSRTTTFKFQSLKSVAYRLLIQQGDIYVLTNRGLFVLGGLAARFASGESVERITTPVMPLPMTAIDMNLACDRWLLVVLANAVIRFDVNMIHDFVPRNIGYNDIVESHSIALASDPQWRDIVSTTDSLAAC